MGSHSGPRSIWTVQQLTASKAHCVNTQGQGQQLKMKEAGMLALSLPSVSTKRPRISLEKKMK